MVGFGEVVDVDPVAWHRPGAAATLDVVRHHRPAAVAGNPGDEHVQAGFRSVESVPQRHVRAALADSSAERRHVGGRREPEPLRGSPQLVGVQLVPPRLLVFLGVASMPP